MSLFALGHLAHPYPQRGDREEMSWLDRASERLRLGIRRRLHLTAPRLDHFVARVEAAQRGLEALGPEARHEALADTRRQLRRDGLDRPETVARAFASVRLAARQHLGFEHFPTQIKGGYILLQGHVAEMDTGEGKTLTATLPAATAALAGLKVHVVTVNDYLARRDVEELGPIYHALGLSTGLVVDGMEPAEKRTAYQADVVYCTNKTVVFDYLRDRVALGARMQPLTLALDALLGREGGVTLRGLQFAIVDEADSVFVDEARTPLIISRPVRDTAREDFYRQAMTLADALASPDHFALQPGHRQVQLTNAGRERLAELAGGLSGLWHGERRREEVVVQALAARHAFERDIHYIVRDGKVMIVDENTGRVMPDRSWERGLQQLVELKEGLEISPEKETLARLSYQLFFRRYLRLAGMTGTCREVSREMAEVYGLGMVRVPPHRPSRRVHLPVRLFPTAAARWQAVVEAVRVRREAGQAVLVGTRSISASEELAALLDAHGIPHQVLNAKQDAEEAVIVARAGEPGRVTIATNMAGRGTDIKLEPAVKAAGGLHVILTERHDNARVDRQLAGRCARQGDPGSVETLLSLEDDIPAQRLPRLRRVLQAWLSCEVAPALARCSGLLFYRLAQRQLERHHRRVRQRLLTADFRSRNALSFTGQME